MAEKEGLVYSHEFWFNYAIVCIFQRIERVFDGMFQILIFEMFYFTSFEGNQVEGLI